MRKVRQIIMTAGALVLATLFASCAAKNPGSSTEVSTAENITKTSSVSEDTAILIRIDREANELGFQNVETGLRYTLNYDATTVFTDRHGNAMSAAQLATGPVADIEFVKDDRKLKSITYSDEFFTYNKVDTFKIYNNETRLLFLDDKYVLDDYLVIASGNDLLDTMELTDGDVLTLYGKDHTIYSVGLERGHGYLRLNGAESFMDGYIEVGGKIIRKITENMMLVVPEGDYDVSISKDGDYAKKHVTIGRNQEVSVDFSDVKHEKMYGDILFILNPSESSLYIDGEKADASAPVKLEYGVHQLICRADGYSTRTSYINVASPTASVSIELEATGEVTEKNDGKDNDDKADESAGKDSKDAGKEEQPGDGANDDGDGDASEGIVDDGVLIDDVATGDGRVYIDAPEGAEVYVDGLYVGIAPAFFTRKEGTVVVTLRKEGFKTRSYTLYLDDSTDDVRYSFSDLVAEN